jgi:hypothetical protein
MTPRTPEERAQRIHDLLWDRWPPTDADWGEAYSAAAGPRPREKRRARKERAA